ncbi:MAG: FAD:protein FMN transferase [Flavobacteriales bacterium]|nr:FAD:protein FMN transferase [Flavobacteriales bacterium]
MSLFINGCSSDFNHPRACIGEVFGTFYSIKYYSKKPISQKDIDTLFEKINRSVSIFYPTSIISKINNCSQTHTDYIFSNIFSLAKKAHHDTNGWFDPTVAPLVRHFGFSTSKTENIDNQKIDSLMLSIGFDAVSMEKDIVKKTHPLTELDFSGIAKGYAVDAVCQYLKKHSVHHFMVEIGGEIRVSGQHLSSSQWVVGIESPFNGDTSRTVIKRLKLKNTAIATSGNYRQWHSYDNGNVVSHIINPHTGSATPSDVISATVLYPQCGLCDAYATALVAMGYKESVSWLKKHPDIQAFLIYLDTEKNVKTYSTPFFYTDN